MKNILSLLFVVGGIAAWYFYPDYKERLPKNPDEVRADVKSLVDQAEREIHGTPATSAQTHDKAKLFVPPNPLPKHDDWTWITTTGVIYNKVQVVKVEADCVTILHSDGGARVDTSTLPPDIQRQLNYNPDIAEDAAAQRSDEMAYSKKTMDAEAAEIKSDQLALATASTATPSADPDGVIKYQIEMLQKTYQAELNNVAVAKANSLTGTSQRADLEQELADRTLRQIQYLQSQLSHPSPAPTSPPASTNQAPSQH